MSRASDPAAQSRGAPVAAESPRWPGPRSHRGQQVRDAGGYASAITRAPLGPEAVEVLVECHLGGGLPSFTIVGLAESAVRDTRERVRAALLAQGFPFPDRRITVNLAPADLPKSGSRYDLAIALAILAAMAEVPADALARVELTAELGLDGSLRSPGPLLADADAAGRRQRRLITAVDTARHAALDPGAHVLAAPDLTSVVRALQGSAALPRARPPHSPTGGRAASTGGADPFAGIHGQEAAKRALVIAATGAHNCLLKGPPGTGKSLLAERLIGLLPPLTEAEALEVARVNAIDSADVRLPERRPFRAPHHSTSATALVGGGARLPKPGEVTRAHHGVLFLDELPEFDRRTLETLREPMETGAVNVVRTAFQARWPARFQLVAAMNPCPAGIECPGELGCRCTPQQRLRYRSRLSAPLLDRIDIHVHVPNPPLDLIVPDTPTATDESHCQPGERAASLPALIAAARERQRKRSGMLNAHLPGPSVLSVCRLDPADNRFFRDAAERLGLSARACHRALRVARSIADLEDRPTVRRSDLGEALAWRARSDD